MDRGNEAVNKNQLSEFQKPITVIPKGVIRHIIKDFLDFVENYDEYELMELDDLIDKFLEMIYEKQKR